MFSVSGMMWTTKTSRTLRRLLAATVAVLAIGGPLAGDIAAAQGRGRDRGERGESRRESSERRGVERRQQMDRAPRRLEPQYNRRLEEAPPRAMRRGGYMSPDSAGPAVDPGRYRLRTPPRGYSWRRVDGGYGLVDENTGRVFDVVPY